MARKFKGYLGNPNLKEAGVKIDFTEEQIREYVRCAENPIYFIKKYIKVVSVDKGLVPFDLYDYQEDMVNKMHNNRYIIAKLPRQSGKSTTIVAYLLHYILFNQSMSVGILANKMNTAREILSRLRLAYEYLPLWLQQGIIEWNKTSIQLENGSKVIASATSSSAIRGGSFNCISGESAMTVRNTETGEIFEVSIGEFYANSSRNKRNHTYLYGNNRKRIQEVVLFPYGEGPNSCYGRESSHRKLSHSSEITWRNQRKIELSDTHDTGTFICTSSSSLFSGRSRKGENVPCVSSNGVWAAGSTDKTISGRINGDEEEVFGCEKTYENWDKTFGRDEEKAVRTQKRKTGFPVNAVKNKSGEQREIVGQKETRGVWEEGFDCFVWNEKDQRTFRQNKQKPRENSKDRRKTPGNETVARIERSDEFGSKETNIPSRWPLEQGDKDGRWEVYTHTGFRKFYGVIKTHNKKTVKVSLSDGRSIVCTPDHKIHSVDKGFVQAKTLSVGDPITCDNGDVAISSIEDNATIDVYDLLEVEEHNSFYANGLRVHQCIFLDEFAHISQNIAEEFFSSVYPTISSGQTTKVFMVSTPNGLNMFYSFWRGATRKPGEEGKNEYIPIEVSWRQVPKYAGGPLRDDAWRNQMIAQTSEQQFDQEFECSFLGSSNTLISASKLNVLPFDKPIEKNPSGLWIYNEPVENHGYFIMVDVARGQGRDFTAMVVVDATEKPHKVVAKYRNNLISPFDVPPELYNLAVKYNNAHLLIEVNDIGGQIADAMHEDYEYENIVQTMQMGRAGQKISLGFGRGYKQRGVRTSAAVKKLGCAVLKNLIEQDKLLVRDYDIIQELMTFVSKHQTYCADDGYTDDLVMCLVLYGWLTRQGHFEEVVEMQKQRIINTTEKEEEDNTTFFAGSKEFDQENTFRDGNTIWYTKE